MQGSAAAGLALAAGMSLARAQDAKAQEDAQAVRKTRSYNPEMDYRRLGKTGAWVSAVCMGGHWKRINQSIGDKEIDPYSQPTGGQVAAFQQNRHDMISCCIEHGINLVDACTGGEVLAYAKALKGRREAMFLDYSWFEKEMRIPQYRTTKALLQGLDEGLKAAELEYVDLWRITCLEKGGQHTQGETEQFIRALEEAKKQGKCRFTGLSSHDRKWLKMLVETYPQQVEVILSPYTADSTELPTESLFDAVRKNNTGFLGIKPFSSNSLFQGDSSPSSPVAEEDDRRARLTIRYILANPAITAPIPGLISRHQIENVVAAVKERRQLNKQEEAELRQAGQEMWARLPEDYQWLREWRYV
jgi:predicted aldo/keto reductase-like oxidoreductase